MIIITACAQNVFLQHERKRWTLTRLANSTHRAMQSSSLTHFSSLTYDLKMNIINVKCVTNNQGFLSQ